MEVFGLAFLRKVSAYSGGKRYHNRYFVRVQVLILMKNEGYSQSAISALALVMNKTCTICVLVSATLIPSHNETLTNKDTMAEKTSI